MRITSASDYAIRTMMCLAANRGVVPASEIADKMRIPKSYLMKVLKRLRDGNFIKAQNGVNGGYVMARPPEDINCLELLLATEGNIAICACIEDKDLCNRDATEFCPMHKLCDDLQQTIENKLAAMTIAKLISLNNIQTSQEI